jgi:hypothetical protein
MSRLLSAAPSPRDFLKGPAAIVGADRRAGHQPTITDEASSNQKQTINGVIAEADAKSKSSSDLWRFFLLALDRGLGCLS